MPSKRVTYALIGFNLSAFDFDWIRVESAFGTVGFPEKSANERTDEAECSSAMFLQSETKWYKMAHILNAFSLIQNGYIVSKPFGNTKTDRREPFKSDRSSAWCCFECGAVINFAAQHFQLETWPNNLVGQSKLLASKKWEIIIYFLILSLYL